MTKPTETTAEVRALVDAVRQVLDDMGRHGHCCCGAAKAELRIAYEPFLAPGDECAMKLDEARAVMDAYNGR